MAVLPSIIQEQLQSAVREKSQAVTRSYHQALEKTTRQGVPHFRDTRAKGRPEGKWLYAWSKNRIMRVSKKNSSDAVYDAGKAADTSETWKGRVHRTMVANRTVNIKA